jgi:succinyl-diaminopimelate desuccinylase
MSAAALDPTDLAARLIRRPSVTPKDEGALDIVAGTLEELGFTCHRLVFDGDGGDEIGNLYAHCGQGTPQLFFADNTEASAVAPEARPSSTLRTTLPLSSSLPVA